jgi:hypothetical protein
MNIIKSSFDLVQGVVVKSEQKDREQQNKYEKNAV